MAGKARVFGRFVGVFLVLLPVAGAGADIWTTAKLSQGRGWLAGAAGGGHVFFAGGYGPNKASAVVDIYDTVLGSWSAASLVEARFGPAGTSAGSVVFFGGGRGDYVEPYPIMTGFPGVDIFDAGTHTCSLTYLCDGGGEYMHAASAAGALVLFAGGLFEFDSDSYSLSRVVSVYNTTTKGRSSAFLSQARFSLSGAAWGTKVLFAGGTTAQDPYRWTATTVASDVVDICDTANMSWSTAQLSQPRANLAGAAGGGKVLFAGGYDGSQYSSVVDIYDAATGAWSTAALSQARSGLAAAAAEGKVFFAGGFDGTEYSNVVDIYDTATGTWSTATLSQARSDLAAAGWGDQVFFAGGYAAGGPSDVVDIVTLPEPTSLLLLCLGVLATNRPRSHRK
jgi:hypothetical protein